MSLEYFIGPVYSSTGDSKGFYFRKENNDQTMCTTKGTLLESYLADLRKETEPIELKLEYKPQPGWPQNQKTVLRLLERTVMKPFRDATEIYNRQFKASTES